MNIEEKNTERYLIRFNYKLWEKLKIYYGWNKFPLIDKSLFSK